MAEQSEIKLTVLSGANTGGVADREKRVIKQFTSDPLKSYCNLFDLLQGDPESMNGSNCKPKKHLVKSC